MKIVNVKEAKILAGTSFLLPSSVLKINGSIFVWLSSAKMVDAPQIINMLPNLGNSLYSDIIQYENNLGKKLTDSELNNYITTAKKHDKKHIPLYFALMSIYNNCDNYILYLHNIKS